MVDLYAQGMTMRQVGVEVGCSAGYVHRMLKAAGVDRRPRGTPKGAQTGPRKDEVTYGQYHQRVRVLRGTPSECSVCGATNDQRYEWANLTGNYDDPDDFSRMCVPCHRTYDAARRKARTDET